MSWTTGEVSKKMGISVRTLRYYDGIDLVKPSKKELSGRRLYSKQDLMKLEKVQILKSLSLSLDDIKLLVEEISTISILKAQRKQLMEQVEQLSNSIDRINTLLNMNDFEGNLDWETLLPLIHSSKERMDSWENYFDEGELELLRLNMPRMEDDSIITKQWISILNRIQYCLRKKILPESEEGVILAKDIILLNEQTFNGNQVLMDKFWDLRKS
ncbi:MerR family transcriptional regulator [Rossellomorea sp. BNER]|uniref:MerR family transcriptional regulator n=1 Tax=Rossellomorea sp. BNER TaxID=2962031 RepID=UPI003AF25A5F|nr:MerR family transcriptional regulator [Rossellomorea sp. BNER]